MAESRKQLRVTSGQLVCGGSLTMWRISNLPRPLAAISLVLICAWRAGAEPVRVRFKEGLVHGFLVLQDQGGRIIANGDLIQTVRGTRVTSRLVFHFRDGSIHDEVAVFSQQRVFSLLSDHLVQKGPAFPHALEMSIDMSQQQVIVRYTNSSGEEEVEAERLDGRSDLANGVLLTILKNVTPETLPDSLSFVVATPKPRLVKLKIRPAGVDSVAIGRNRRKAMHYVIAVDLGGVTELFAELFGKKPPDSHVWILGGNAPAFVTSEQPFYARGPLWQIHLVSPVIQRLKGNGRP